MIQIRGAAPQSDKPFSCGSIEKLTRNLGAAANSSRLGTVIHRPVMCEHSGVEPFPFHSL
jgi:hypothetical protein